MKKRHQSLIFLGDVRKKVSKFRIIFAHRQKKWIISWCFSALFIPFPRLCFLPPPAPSERGGEIPPFKGVRGMFYCYIAQGEKDVFNALKEQNQ